MYGGIDGYPDTLEKKMNTKKRKLGVLYMDGEECEIIPLSPFGMKFAVAKRGTFKRFLLHRGLEGTIGLWFNLLWVVLVVWWWIGYFRWWEIIGIGVGGVVLGICWGMVKILERKSGNCLK